MSRQEHFYRFLKALQHDELLCNRDSCMYLCVLSHFTKTLRMYVRCTQQSLTNTDKLSWLALWFTRLSFLLVLNQSVTLNCNRPM
jgi:hypothetical protein